MKTSFGICRQAYIPLRAEDDERSEQVSQILFGERFIIERFEKKSGFSYVISDFDEYSGWIDTKTIVFIEEKDYRKYEQQKVFCSSEIISRLESEDQSGAFILIGAGSSIYENEKKFQIGTRTFKIPQNLFKSFNDKRTFLLESGKKLESIPYLWGGRSSFGFDCSGLVQNLYKQAGVVLPRDSTEQSRKGKVVNFFHEALPGDLAFFDDEEMIIKHVGVIMEGNKILHASGKVRIDKLDHQGIFSEDIQAYTHKLRLIRNVIED